MTEADTPVTGVRAFKFSLVSADGAVKWSSEPVQVQVTDGLYSTVLSGFSQELLSRAGLKLRVMIGNSTLDNDLPLIPVMQAVTAFSVTPGAVGTTGMVDGAVTTEKIADKTITAEKLADGLVLSGPPGPAGQSGADGRTILSGIGSPDRALGREGDWYVDTAAVALSGPKADGAWPAAIPLVGAMGPRGADGTAVRSGHGAPMPGVGVDGDFYVDTDSTVWYGPKAAGAWPVGLPLGHASSLAVVATSGSYLDLTNRPSLGTAAPLNKAVSGDAAADEVVIGSDTRLNDQRVPNDGSVSTAKLANSAVTDAKVSDVTWSKVTSRPTTLTGYGITDAASSAQGTKADSAVQPGALATVATSGAYTDLSNRPSLGTAAPLNKAASGDAAVGEVVIGSDSRLSDQRVPTDGSVSTAKLANSAVTDAKVSDVTWSKVTSRPTTLSGYGITDAASSAQGTKADTAVQPGALATVATSGSYTDLSNRPSLATVATSGSYADLTNRPSLATVATSGVSKDVANPATSLAGASVTPDASQGLLFTWTLSANGTLNAPSNLSAGQVMVLRIVQDSTGGRSVTWNSAYTWSGGTAPSVTAAANAVDVLIVMNIGNVLHSVLTQDLR